MDWSPPLVRHSFALALLALALPSQTAAQTSAPPDDQKRWGIAASFSPMWKGNLTLQQKLFWTDPEEEDPQVLEGSEFTIGFVRGTTRGGDWGVNYVRKPIKDYNSAISEGPITDCSGTPQQCYTYSFNASTSTHNVLVDGVEVHFFLPFVRFANRVQMGLGVGGGVGFSSGTYTSSYSYTTTLTQAGQPTITDSFSDTFTEEAADEIIGAIVPLAKVEFQTAILVARGLKVNVAVGMNLPSAVSFRIGMVYLFGAR
jgi:hypothetical protein